MVTTVDKWCRGVWLLGLAAGCAHHHGNNYAYAPPYAPPAYPQPASVAQPVSAAAPVGVPQAPGQPTLPSGVVVAGQTTPCPEACPDGAVVGVPVIVEGGGQTPPCPPAP